MKNKDLNESIILFSISIIPALLIYFYNKHTHVLDRDRHDNVYCYYMIYISFSILFVAALYNSRFILQHLVKIIYKMYIKDIMKDYIK